MAPAMFVLSFQTTFLATLQILFLGAVGYFLVKRGIVDEDGLRLFSRLIINLFLPSFIFSQLLGNFRFELYPNWWIFPILSFAVTLIGFLVSQLVFLLNKNKIPFKKEFVALVAFQNSGYLPLILVATLFSSQQAQILYVYIFLFLIGFDLILWSWGVKVLAHHSPEKFELKNLTHSPVAAIVVSLFMVWVGLEKIVPSVILKPIKMLGDCTLPLAMIVMGGNLARLESLEKRPSGLSLVMMTKLIVLPLIASIVVLILRVDFLVGFLFVLEAAVPSAISLSVIAHHYRAEENFINQALFWGHLMCIFTLPVFLMFYTRLRGTW